MDTFAWLIFFMVITNNLLDKYNVAVPRYTSYPTVPFWDETINKHQWKRAFQQQFVSKNSVDGVSLYLHLPFCESLCTYCGCNKKITTNHSVEGDYIETILKEWAIYRSLMTEAPIIRELHLGGGTPTFFSPANLTRLLEGIFNSAVIHPQHEFSFEGHPNNTTTEHLQTLYDLGFRRVSYGVQDNDPEVQRVINRIQPVENVQLATDIARETGYQSVNFDLIYGLPLQNMERMRKTILQAIAMKPDRIAFYSYAHVPWTSRGQRLFDEKDLPSTEEKMQLYQLGKKLFTENGYINIGMDHFALPTDDLCKAHTAGNLHRNFMGYTTQHTSMIIGLGVSSISDAGIAFAQNEKKLHNYTTAINANELAVFRGYFLTEEDVAFRNYILDISCRGSTIFRVEDIETIKQLCYPALKKMEADDLLYFTTDGLVVTTTGLNFIRNICSAFDLKLWREGVNSSNPVFSKAI
jgi:oxygen-independent coproporphyrinogen-3 oxidase